MANPGPFPPMGPPMGGPPMGGHSQWMIRVVVIARSEHICPKKTGLLIAAEEGLDAHICESVNEAVAWLDSCWFAGKGWWLSTAAVDAEASA